MKTLFFVSLSFFFFSLVALGVVSMSPLGESQHVERFIDTVMAKLTLLSRPDSLSNQLVAKPSSMKTPTPQVLGLQTKSKTLQPTILYNLINGSRTERGLPPLHINSSLEKAAEELIASRLRNTAPPIEERTTITNYGYPVKELAILESQPATSLWEILTAWQKEPKDELLLHSPSFIDMGMAVSCPLQTGAECQILLVLAGT